MASRRHRRSSFSSDVFHETVRRLRAVRHYRDASVPDSAVAEWLESARWCGSSKNSQPWRFIVIRSRRTLDALSKLGTHAGHLATANVAVAVVMMEGPYRFSTIFDLGRVVQNLMLAAHADGVGSCVAVFEPAQNIAHACSILGVPADARLDLAVAFGFAEERYAATNARPSPPGRLPLGRLVFVERYGISAEGRFSSSAST